MSHRIARLGEDAYTVWSTVVEAPLTGVLTREQLEDWLLVAAFEKARAGIISQLAWVDRYGTNSTFATHAECLEELATYLRTAADADSVAMALRAAHGQPRRRRPLSPSPSTGPSTDQSPDEAHDETDDEMGCC